MQCVVAEPLEADMRAVRRRYLARELPLLRRVDDDVGIAHEPHLVGTSIPQCDACRLGAGTHENQHGLPQRAMAEDTEERAENRRDEDIAYRIWPCLEIPGPLGPAHGHWIGTDVDGMTLPRRRRWISSFVGGAPAGRVT